MADLQFMFRIGGTTEPHGYPSIGEATRQDHDAILAKINSFSSLPMGWHYGDGGPISGLIIDMALRWYNLIISRVARDVDVSPSETGAVLFGFTLADRYTEVMCEADGDVTVVHERNAQKPIYLNHISERMAEGIISQIAGERQPWNVRYGSTRININIINGGSIATPSGITRGAERLEPSPASQRWSANVSNGTVELSTSMP
jgi:hypothetical protein